MTTLDSEQVIQALKRAIDPELWFLLSDKGLDDVIEQLLSLGYDVTITLASAGNRRGRIAVTAGE